MSACMREITIAGSPSTGTITAESQSGQPPGCAMWPVSQRKFAPAVT